MSEFLYNSEHGFLDGPCPAGETEQCVRICWVDECLLSWDLWVRWREEDNGGTPPSDKWASYLNPGPVGALGFELSSDSDKPGAEGSAVCSDPAPNCGLSAGTNGFAGEMICWCIEDDGNFPKTIDVVVNLFGADSDCPDPLGDVCVEYFCCDDEFMGEVHTSEITGAFDFEDKGTAGNEGNGDFRMPKIVDSSPDCTDKDVDPSKFSTCWSISGVKRDGTYFVSRGPGRAPRKFVIPDDVDASSCVLVEDGAKIPRKYYDVMHESVAEEAGVEVMTLEDMGYTRGRRATGRGRKKRKKRKGEDCANCKKKGKFRLF